MSGSRICWTTLAALHYMHFIHSRAILQLLMRKPACILFRVLEAFGSARQLRFALTVGATACLEIQTEDALSL